MTTETTTLSEVRERLRRVGMRVPAVVLATAVTFGGLAAALPAFASAAPAQSANNAPDPHLNKLRKLVNTTTDPVTRHALERYVAWAEANPNSSCLTKCLAEKYIAGGLPSPASDGFAKVLIDCGVECVDKATLKELKRKAAEWAKDGYRQESLNKAADLERQRVKELRKQAKDKNLTPEQRAAAEARLPDARNRAAKAVTAANRYRKLVRDADFHDGLADLADSKQARDQWRKLADAAKTEAKNVADAAKDERRGKGGKTGGTGGTGDPGGSRLTGGTGHRSTGGGHSRKLGFGPLDLLLGGEDPYAGLRQELAVKEQNARDSAELLRQYLHDHPHEGGDLIGLMRQPGSDLPFGAPDRLRAYLAEWDRTHDDAGRSTRTMCDIANELGAGCDPRPRPAADIATDREAARQALRDDNKAVSTTTTARDNTRDALIADKKNVSGMTTDQLVIDRAEEARQALRDDNKAVSAKHTKDEKTAAAKEKAQEAMRIDKQAASAKETKKVTADREAARQALRDDNKAASAKHTKELATAKE
ncbi:hypothetical protein, partial [Actinophytocola sp.]|uniref:hypothetical protein n=1 Tax=Actinophytocola sp. TaxID=1872138 RepID=UPI002ED9B38C